MNENNEQVMVRRRNDHSRVRPMTARAFEINSDKWELVPDPETEVDRSQLAIQMAQKKRHAVSVGETESVVETTEEHKTEFVDITEQSINQFIGQSFEGNFTPQPIVEDLGIDVLRDEYAIKSGKPADKRWKPSRIQLEIEKLTQQ